MNANHIEAAKIIDERVLGKNGEALGRIIDLLISTHGGRIDFACIELSRHQNDRQLAYVPWSQLQVSVGGRVHLDVSRDTLAALSRWQINLKEDTQC